MGYDWCPYLSFFVPRFEDEIFDLTGRRDLNTEYAIFDLRCYDMKCSRWFDWDEKPQRDTQIHWRKRDPTPHGDSVVSLGKMIAYYRIGLKRQLNEDKIFSDISWPDTLGMTLMRKLYGNCKIVCLLELVTWHLVMRKGRGKMFVC